MDADGAARTKVRVTKDPAVRREELLDTALTLCGEHGFDGLRVEQVVQAAGIAKGTFYHYFGSKDDLLEALIERFGNGLFDELNAAAHQAVDTDAAGRLRAVMDASGRYKLSQQDVTLAGLLYREDNLPMRHRVFRTWRERAAEVLAPIITAGNLDGSFRVFDTDGATDIILLLWFEAASQLWDRAARAEDADAFATILVTGARSISEAQERVLGVPEGTYTMPIGPEVIELTKQLFATIQRRPQ